MGKTPLVCSKKFPWGIIAGACAIAVFYATAAIIILFMVGSGVKGQTNETASLFDEWYQTLLFVADLIFFLAMAASSVMSVLTKKGIFEKESKATNENI